MTLLSGVHAAFAPRVQAPAVVLPIASALSGTLKGSYYGVANVPYYGSVYDVNARGQLRAPSGTSHLYGSLNFHASPSAGQRVGTVEIVNGRNTMTLNLFEPSSVSTSSPFELTYKVVAATGSARNERGVTGTVAVSLTSSVSTSSNLYFDHGSVTFAF